MKNLQDLCLRCEMIKAQFNGLDASDAATVLCTMIDHVAFINNMSSEEFLNMISPLIIDINKELGPIYPEFMQAKEDK